MVKEAFWDPIFRNEYEKQEYIRRLGRNYTPSRRYRQSGGPTSGVGSGFLGGLGDTFSKIGGGFGETEDIPTLDQLYEELLKSGKTTFASFRDEYKIRNGNIYITKQGFESILYKFLRRHGLTLPPPTKASFKETKGHLHNIYRQFEEKIRSRMNQQRDNNKV